MARPKKDSIQNIVADFGWLDPSKYREVVKERSDLELVRNLFDRSCIYGRADQGSEDLCESLNFRAIMEGSIFPADVAHGYYFDKSACNDFGHLGEAREVAAAEFIEPLSANNILLLNAMLPYDDDPMENLVKRREFYTYQSGFGGLFCLNINDHATDSQILAELKRLLPRLRKAYKIDPVTKGLTRKVKKFRDINLLALFDFLIYWKHRDFGECLAPVICEVIYGGQRTPEEVKDTELKIAMEYLDWREGSWKLILMGRSLQPK